MGWVKSNLEGVEEDKQDPQGQDQESRSDAEKNKQGVDFA